MKKLKKLNVYMLMVFFFSWVETKTQVDIWYLILRCEVSNMMVMPKFLLDISLHTVRSCCTQFLGISTFSVHIHSNKHNKTDISTAMMFLTARKCIYQNFPQVGQPCEMVLCSVLNCYVAVACTALSSLISRSSFTRLRKNFFFCGSLRIDYALSWNLH